MVRVIEDAKRTARPNSRIVSLAKKHALSESIDKYPEEAARLRREAENTKHPVNRQQLLDIAEQYDRLADSAERTPLQ
jgi:uncharacterized protein Yka (UPF0111/DUF47 family)